MKRHLYFIGIVLALCTGWAGCKDDVPNSGSAVLDEDDAIIVLADTFSLESSIVPYEAVISQSDSFLLGELETDYGLLQARILTQFACPEGYHYPENAEIDSICLFMYYASWVGDGNSPMAVDAYLMDKATFSYLRPYTTDINVDDYCSRDKSVLTNHRIVVATERLDSVQNSNGNYIPMLRMRLNDDFTNYFGAIRSFEDQDSFNRQFKGLMIESSFGSSTVLNISDVALGVYYHFSYAKAGKDTTVSDMKAFYANSEVRTINQIQYIDKEEWIDAMREDSLLLNYIVAPAGVYTRVSFPMQQMVEDIFSHLLLDSLGEMIYLYKRPYVNKAQVRVEVANVYSGTESGKTRNDWLQPASYMLLVNEKSVERFFANKELPTDTCALLSSLIQDVDSTGETIYYYSFDMSDLLTRQLRQDSLDSQLNMLLVPVTVTTATSSTSSTTSISSVKEQQTISATAIYSATNGMDLKIVYSGF